MKRGKSSKSGEIRNAQITGPLKPKLGLSPTGIVGPDGKVIERSIKRLPKLDKEKTLDIYAPCSWPFVYRKFFVNFLRIIHPKMIAPLRKFGITDYFWDINSKFPVCKNRNLAVQKAQKHNADYIMFLDADMQHPPDIIYRLVQHELPIVSGMYFHQAPPHLPVAYKHKEAHNYVHCWDYPKDTLFNADLIGMGCVLVDMRVFDDIDMPYFKYDSSREDGIVDVTEDVEFCRKATQAGYSIMVDPSIQCTHISIEDVAQTHFEAYMEQYHSYTALMEKFGDGTIRDGCGI